MAQAIQVSSNVSSVVRGWLHSSDTTEQNISLPSSPVINIRSERLGLGAETWNCSERQKKEERSILFKKIQKRIIPNTKRQEPEYEDPKLKNGKIGTSLTNDDSSDDESCSRNNVVNKEISRKRQKLEALKTRRLTRKKNKRKKRATEDKCIDQQDINNDIFKNSLFVETNSQDMLTRRAQNRVGVNEVHADKHVNIDKDTSGSGKHRKKEKS